MPNIMVRMDIRKGETTNTTVQVKRTDGKKLEIKKVEGSKPWLTAKLLTAEKTENADDQTARISIEAKPDGPL
jgi:hypothetical protein